MNSLARPLLAGLIGLAAIAARGDQASPPATPPAAAVSPPAAAPTPPPPGDIEDFVPSEKLSADDAVAFPVDI